MSGAPQTPWQTPFGARPPVTNMVNIKRARGASEYQLIHEEYQQRRNDLARQQEMDQAKLNEWHRRQWVNLELTYNRKDVVVPTVQQNTSVFQQRQNGAQNGQHIPTAHLQPQARSSSLMMHQQIRVGHPARSQPPRAPQTPYIKQASTPLHIGTLQQQPGGLQGSQAGVTITQNAQRTCNKPDNNNLAIPTGIFPLFSQPLAQTYANTPNNFTTTRPTSSGAAKLQGAPQSAKTVINGIRCAAKREVISLVDEEDHVDERARQASPSPPSSDGGSPHRHRSISAAIEANNRIDEKDGDFILTSPPSSSSTEAGKGRYTFRSVKLQNSTPVTQPHATTPVRHTFQRAITDFMLPAEPQTAATSHNAPQQAAAASQQNHTLNSSNQHNNDNRVNNSASQAGFPNPFLNSSVASWPNLVIADTGSAPVTIATTNPVFSRSQSSSVLPPSGHLPGGEIVQILGGRGIGATADMDEDEDLGENPPRAAKRLRRE